MACGSLDLFPSFFEKYNKNSFLICLPNFPSSLQYFEQFAVSEHRADFCKVPNCQYHVLIHDESIDLSSFNTDLNCDFSSQSVDWLFTSFKHYFPCNIQIQGFVFQKLLSAIDFHRSLKYLVLTNLTFTKKRLLRKKFRTKRNYAGRVNLLFLDHIQQPNSCWKLVQFLNQKSAKNSCKLSLIYIPHSNNVRSKETV